jgi:two-component system cell cycle sensor histidine kinase/response regulator CckA
MSWDGIREWLLDWVAYAIECASPRRLSQSIKALVQGTADRGLRWTAVDPSLELLLDNEMLRAELAAHRATETALRESESLFRNLANTAPVGIWVTDVDTRVSFLNRTALAFVGRPMEEMLGENWTDLLHPADKEQVLSTCAAAVAQKGAFRTECRLRRTDGQYRWLLNTGTPRFVNGAYIGHIGTVSDTTDLRRNHEEMLAAQKLESLGLLAAGIAHDFNNMLGAIFGDSDLALAEVPSDTPVADSIERIKAVAVRASEIVKLLLIYAEGTEAAKVDVDLSAIVQEMIEVARRSLSPQTALSTHFAKDLPSLRANPGQIRQVVLNLIMNASEALDKREGSIVVTTEKVHVSKTMARNYGSDLLDGDYACLTVTDTGCGIRKEVQAKIFDPFYTTKFLGRGLGLAVVQGIVRSHHGAVNLLSAPGTGSTFEVLLPSPAERLERSGKSSFSPAADRLPN